MRKEAGLTQGKAAELAGLETQTIGNMERGKHSPTANTLCKIMEVYGVSPRILFESITY
jgi:transcriptional regulator with XRE-family HTH domain